VEQVTWYDAVEFCNKLSAAEGLTSVYTITGRTPATGYPITSATVTTDFSKSGYRLPTEAQWEYAAKGGQNSRGYTYPGSDNLDAVAWYNINSGSKTHEVGKLAPNELGIYDMGGNVWEWCWDWFGEYPGGTQQDYMGASSDFSRIQRGGSWYNSAVYLRSENRGSYYPQTAINTMGFRVMRP